MNEIKEIIIGALMGLTFFQFVTYNIEIDNLKKAIESKSDSANIYQKAYVECNTQTQRANNNLQLQMINDTIK